MIEIGRIRIFGDAELAQLMGISLVTVKRYLRSGKLRGRKVGGQVYVTEDNLRDFLSCNQESPLLQADHAP